MMEEILKIVSVTVGITITGCAITLLTLFYCLSSECKFCKFVSLGICKFLQSKRGGELVILKDYQDKTYITLAYAIDGESTMYSHVYASHEIGELTLHEDGTVTDLNGTNTYIYNWLPYNKNDRTFMILKYDARVFEYI